MTTPLEAIKTTTLEELTGMAELVPGCTLPSDEVDANEFIRRHEPPELACNRRALWRLDMQCRVHGPHTDLVCDPHHEHLTELGPLFGLDMHWSAL